jgi:hypothetical protein
MTSDSAVYFVVRASEWLNPIVHLIGLAVCVWAYRVCRKRAYLVVAAYFLLAAGGLLFGPMIKRTLAERSPALEPLSAEAEQRYQEEFMALCEKYYPSTGEMPALRAHPIDIEFPLGPIILVSGLWMLAKWDRKKITEPGAAPNGGPAASVINPRASDGSPPVS